MAKTTELELSAQVYDLTKSMLAQWNAKIFFKELLKIYGTADHSVNQALANDRAVNVASETVDDSMERPDLAIRQRVYFRFLKKEEDVAPAVELVKNLKEVNNTKNRFQFIICCSPNALCLYDLVQNDSLSIDLADLPDYYSFLLPIKEGRRKEIVSNKEADKKACLKLTRLLETLAKHNDIDPDHMQKLNSFIRRILFCFFAEDTGIFQSYGRDVGNMFTNSFDKLVNKHGTNAKQFFTDLFTILNTKPEDKEQYRHRMAREIYDFPYVNGGLFKDLGYIPDFDLATRNQLIDCGRLAWHEISPAIFGAMFQSALDKTKRRNLGAHYTSEENILKILKPLFLDKLHAEFAQLKKDTEPMLQEIESIPLLKTKRDKHIDMYPDNLSMKAIEIDLKRKKIFTDFLERIGRMKFLDPACGCGNFLLIAYKELRELENDVLEYINAGNFTDSYININQFYGIEIEDWPAEIAHVSMWLMQHLLNQQTNARFGTNIQSIPLQSSITIANVNALTTDWNEVLPAAECSYVFGNPPFSGTTFTTEEQKQWVKNVYPPKYKTGLVDYASAWFVKSSDYMATNKNIEAALVATNSICQGVQVKTLWKLLLERGININFAYSTFPWKNDAADRAGVHCVIVGFSYHQAPQPFIGTYIKESKSTVIENCKKISPYLTPISDENIIVSPQSKALSSTKNLVFGNKPADGSNLIFSFKEGSKLLEIHPEVEPFIKKFIGSDELINGTFRYCLWLTEDRRNEWEHIPAIMERIEKVRQFRLSSKKKQTVNKAETPWKFAECSSPSNPESALVIPMTSSENRYYIPMDFIKKDTIVSNLAFILPDASDYDFGILTSRMHMDWMRLTTGKLKSDYRYSRNMAFNTFIWPEVSDAQKENITALAKNIRIIRAKNAPKTLAELYGRDTMPKELKEAHAELDLAVEKAYRSEPFENDEERLAFLLSLYYEAIVKEITIC